MGTVISAGIATMNTVRSMFAGAALLALPAEAQEHRFEDDPVVMVRENFVACDVLSQLQRVMDNPRFLLSGECDPVRAGDRVRVYARRGPYVCIYPHDTVSPSFPKVLLDKFELMSNSGGSWGADGFLYLTGHDPAELYRARLPKAGSVLELVNTIPMNIRGQGIAWDRSQSGTIYGIIRATAMERLAGGSHRVTVFKLSEKP